MQELYSGIDWYSQWVAFGRNFIDGHCHINLSEFGSKSGKLLLEPGPGFGDLSHPTTCLMLQLMSSVIADQVIIDIGSGSGVLTLAALLMGSKRAYGIDIECSANLHAQQNSLLNKLQDKVAFTTPSKFLLPEGDAFLILMNMIECEQKEAWQSLPCLHPLKTDWITSGVLVEDRERYLAAVKERGWKIKKEQEQDGWLAFHFSA